jgi:hypothetical protein
MIFSLAQTPSERERAFVRSTLATLILVAAASAVASQPVGVQPPPPKVPHLVASEALYGIFVFGTNSSHPVWAVFDKSAKDQTHYDVLYLDIDADGDLTESAERVVSPTRASGKEAMATFAFPEFTEPGSARKHKDFTVTWRPQRVSASIKWLGNKKMNAGYGPETAKYGKFATSPGNAPVYVLGHELPFQFQHWMSDKFTRGQDNDFKVFMGNLGQGQGAFCAVDQEFLPKNDYVVATLIYKTESGAEKQEKFNLKDRC